MAEPGSPMPDVFEAFCTPALQQLQHPREMASPLWAVANVGSQMPGAFEARCTAVHQKKQLWAVAEPGSPMPDILEAFRTAAHRQLGLAGLMTANPGARRSELCAMEDAAQLCPLSAEKADVAPDSGAILGPLSLAGRCTAAQQKLQLWAMAEPSSPMPDVLEAFCTAAPRQLSLAGLMAADPGARRSELYAVEDYYSSVVSALCREGGRGPGLWCHPGTAAPRRIDDSESCGSSF